jgi:hypothetical protein
MTNTLSSTLRNQLASPLLRLPAEIRNKIYTYVGYSTTVTVDIVSTPFPVSDKPISHLYFKLPALQKSSKQIRHEASSILRKLATFDFPKSAAVPIFILDGSDHKIGAFITSIRISYSFAESVAGLVFGNHGLEEFYRSPSVGWLRNLETIHVNTISWKSALKDDDVRAALRYWFDKETLEVSFREFVG